ncbi:aminodeoxychorismate synthase component I [Altererythrobacter lutimaris]|uniref:Probable branched-chain-amino-acid aminotransferase n=1 Tax=Altererythrobacter lutimaris TaxID=2743979 RepID=A0A850HCZ4_9SPHN|nr:aminodeoxychorismate synthase component I [Altererythrobacter lutimaris]NVE95205.1 aminodeoxychorismate synthase component I [Altererythrobacter lutimaris]
MRKNTPFVLLDDARQTGAADAQLFTEPSAVFVARRAGEVETVLAAADAARRERGGSLAGYIAYEAGLALEPKLAGLADERSGAEGPLVWLGLFDAPQIIAAGDVGKWLEEHGGGEAASLGPMTPQLSTGGYEAGFAALQDAIRAGDIYQVNYTYRLAGSYKGDPLALYAALRPSAQAGYGGMLFDGSHCLLSLSPELFVSLQASQARVKPMKGTRPRGRDAAEDAALAEDLASSEKDKAENLMIVDLMRNDLSRVAVAGSVNVDAPFAVESYPTVHQMVSTVSATLAEGKGAMDLLRAIFPCGSITGAPKIRAMELIAEHESAARGPYCGALGRIDASGNAALNVAIRTLRLTPIENAQGSAVLGVGSAIVADSDALAERRESEVKAGFARRSSPDHRAAQFDLIETMRFDPENGIELLELHLERIKASAATLGFAFDRHAARNQIQALCFDLEDARKVRMMVSRRGEVALEASSLPKAASDPIKAIALPLPVDEGDWRLRHKTTDRAFYEEALEAAKQQGAGEAILVRPDGLVTEGSYTNIFVRSESGILLTPPASLGLLPGVFQRSLIENGEAREAELTLDDLADGFLLGNAVRGLTEAKLI